MTCPTPKPTREGYIAFLRNYAGVPETALPDDSEIITYVLCSARDFLKTGMGLERSPIVYTRTLYNMATSLLLNYAEDQPGQKFFQQLRDHYKLNELHTGIITSAADQGTSGTVKISKAMEGLSLADLQLLQDPFGRKVAAVLMELGPIWGYTA